MIVSMNGTEFVSMNDTQKKVLKNEIQAEELDKDLKRRVMWSVQDQYDAAFVRFKEDWDEKLAENGVQSIPVDKDSYIALVLDQPNCDLPEISENDSTISVDDSDLFVVSTTQKRILKKYGQKIAQDAPSIDDWIKLRIRWILNLKYSNCYVRLKKEWEKKLIAAGATNIPLDKDAFAALVFEQEDYKDRDAREAESKPLF